MTFSDAIPVQFWLIDCDTYNEEERFGLYHRCFCAPWECDDEIKIQFQDDGDQNFSLLVYDDEESLLDEIEIEEVEDGVYQTSLILSENTPDICDKNVRLEIRKNAGFQGISLPALSLWANSGGSGDPWSLGANPSFTASGGSDSEFIFVDYAFIPGNTYSIGMDFTWSSVALTTQYSLLVTDASFNTQFSDNAIGNDSGSDSLEVNFTATSSTTRICFRVSSTIVDSTTITLNSISGAVQVGEAEIVAKSDCLLIKEEHPGTVLIAYSNYRNYAGIINYNGSPDLTFYLRIPAVFNEERFPETDEPMQLSNNRIISLNSQVKKQRLLETDQMPNYMHLKVKEVLKHQFVTIEDVDYVKEEPYEQVENGNKRWPMRRYTCWLTEKEYVVRNIL